MLMFLSPVGWMGCARSALGGLCSSHCCFWFPILNQNIYAASPQLKRYHNKYYAHNAYFILSVVECNICTETQISLPFTLCRTSQQQHEAGRQPRHVRLLAAFDAAAITIVKARLWLWKYVPSCLQPWASHLLRTRYSPASKVNRTAVR